MTPPLWLALTPELRIPRVPKRITEEVEAQHGQADGEAGEDREPRRLLHEGAAGAREHRVGRVRLEHRDDRQREHESRDRLDRVHDALNDEVQSSLAVSAEKADDHAGRRADADGEQPDPERDAGAVDDSAQDVAADV